MADSAIAQAVRAQKNALLAKDAATMRELTRAWLEVEKALAPQIELLSLEVESLRAAGKEVPIGRIYRLERLKSLLNQAREETAKYAGTAADIITSAQREMVAIGIQDAQSVLVGAVGGQFDRLSTLAVESMIASTSGVAADGAPLRQLLLDRLVPQLDGLSTDTMVQGLVNTLRQGMAQGWNPKKTAKLMKGSLAGGLDKALLIARTETMRAYRTANTQQMRDSGVVEGQVRMCAHTPSTCAACLADEGNVYPLDEEIPDHPRGRCTGVPWIKGMPKPTFETGEAWFGKQSTETQRGILGPKRYDLWKDGKATFADFAILTDHTVWGGGLGVTPVRDLSAAAG